MGVSVFVSVFTPVSRSVASLYGHGVVVLMYSPWVADVLHG